MLLVYQAHLTAVVGPQDVCSCLSEAALMHVTSKVDGRHCTPSAHSCLYPQLPKMVEAVRLALPANPFTPQWMTNSDMRKLLQFLCYYFYCNLP